MRVLSPVIFPDPLNQRRISIVRRRFLNSKLNDKRYRKAYGELRN